MLVRNAIWNIGGQLLPLLAAVAVIPLLLREMGAEGFGLVAIVWTLIGYFSLFDFGLGRALTKFVSLERVRHAQAVPDIVVNGVALLVMLGLVMAGLMWTLVPWLVGSVLKPRTGDPAEIIAAFRVAALTIPLVVVNVGLRAVLEGFLRFDLTNLVRIPFGLFTIVAPAVVAYFEGGMTEIVVAVAGGVFMATLAYVALLIGSRHATDIKGGTLCWPIATRLARFGGWISVSNFVAPVIFHLDRFVISAVLSVAVMSYYVVPYEAITKTLVFSSAIAGTLFPVFAGVSADNDKFRLSSMLTGTRVVIALMFPALLAVASFRFELLDLWVGRDAAINGSGPLLLLAAGVFFNAVAYMPYTLAQASGHADVVARLQLLQVPIYPALLWLGVVRLGLEGAALVWAFRALFEMVVFLLLAGKIVRVRSMSETIVLYVVLGTLISLIGFVLSGLELAPRALSLTGFVLLFLFVLWSRVISQQEKLWMSARWRFVVGQLFGMR